MSALRILALLIALPVAASIAFMIVEGWNFFDSLYMAVITLTTVGFMEVHPMSDAGRIVVIVYLVGGLGIFFYGVAYVAELLLRAPIGEIRRRKRMNKQLETIENHVVVCGYGRVGSNLCGQLQAVGQPVVVIDRDEQTVKDAMAEGVIALRGDATRDALLEEAGIRRARALAAVTPSDADNLYIVLSGRILNTGIQIVSRSTDSHSIEKLERAGANRIVNMYETGAHRMAMLLTHPRLEDFWQLFTAQGDRLDLTAVSITEASPYIGKRLNQTDLHDRGVMIVAHQKPGKDIAIPPAATAEIELGDTMFAFGNAQCISELLEAAR